MSTDELLKPPFTFPRCFAAPSETENPTLVRRFFLTVSHLGCDMRHKPKLNFASAIMASYDPESKMKNESKTGTQNTKQAADFVTARSGAS